MPIIVTTRALIIHHHQLLMCKHPQANFFCLPGGKLELGETLTQGLERELIEETGIKPQIGKLLFINQFLNPENHRLEFFFLIKNTADYASFNPTKASHSFEIAEFALADPADPKYNLKPSFLRHRFADIAARGAQLETEVIQS